MSRRCVTLAGAWPLDVSLQAMAAARGLAIVPATAENPGESVLRWNTRGAMRTLILPDLMGIRERMSRHVVAALLASMSDRPSTVTGTVLVPAAGVCGPAATGPVNAVRLGSPLRFRADGDADVTVVLGTMQVQHTRCWLFELQLHGAGLHNVALHPQAVVRRLPAQLAQDTARAVDHLCSARWGADWPGVYLLDLTQAAIDSCRAALICSDAELVGAVLDGVMDRLGDR